MKSINQILSEMLESGKLPEQPKKITRINNKMNNLEAQAILFSVFNKFNQADLKAVMVCEYIGQALKYIVDDENELMSLNDVSSILNAILLQLTKDINGSKFFTSLFILEYFEADRTQVVEFYKTKKYLLNKR